MLTFVEQETYTLLPNGVLGDLLPELDARGIPYVKLVGPDIPLEYDEPYAELAGIQWPRFCCLKTNLDPDSLKAFVLDLCFRQDKYGNYHFKSSSRSTKRISLE